MAFGIILEVTKIGDKYIVKVPDEWLYSLYDKYNMIRKKRVFLKLLAFSPIRNTYMLINKKR